MYPDLEAFLTAKASVGLSAPTLHWYNMFIANYLAWAEGQHLDMKQPETIEGFLTYLRVRKLSPFTVSGCYRALRVFFKWLVQRKRLRRNPLSEIQPPKLPKHRKQHVTELQFRQLYKSIDGDSWVDARDRAILLILFYSGLRASELVGLRVADVDRIRMVLRVNQGKGDKDRDVPFVPQLLEQLDEYLEKRPSGRYGYLLLARNGHHAKQGHLTYEGLKEIMRRRCAAAGMSRLGLHSFRHGYAMLFLNAGMEIGVLSQTLGHSSMETTRRFYADWVTTEISRQYQSALRRIGPPPTLPSDS